MTVYADTSVLISAVAHDVHTKRARVWFMTGPLVLTSTWALAEGSSVLAIKVRQGVLKNADARRAERQIEAIAAGPLALEAIGPVDVLEARRLVRSSINLRAPDALHLAVALRLDLPMATFDDGLKQAAVEAGCAVVDL